jgi:hypothetical protein
MERYVRKVSLRSGFTPYLRGFNSCEDWVNNHTYPPLGEYTIRRTAWEVSIKMEPIYPLNEDRINQFCGVPVCIVTHEGNRHVGILSSCRNGRVTLNAGSEKPNTTSPGIQGTVTNVKGKNKKKNQKGEKLVVTQDGGKAVTQSVYPYDPYGGYAPYYPYAEAFAIDLALIAFLFLLL